ncbi:flagellar basal-body MS-ring/collar protein FliF [Neopusillimonas maritima]|jgi:flagellar M-ring protein FliF|uniref:Flagellar M-ring protein n=1 Tax=Neopusillimonas maritima TaxID=2026239 RepID=A0ABX9N134_9BURK|nr:flagellar basal-body MS-ring/collar protein FliF [Neopusillimonas maritima]RII83956.1 flagellar M-ring protein FliF [Neopusillimonas maritima]
MSQASALLARFPAAAKLGQLPKPVLIGIASGILALIVVIALWARPADYKVLFSNLEDRDGGAIVAALSQMNVPYRISNNGTAILVPADQVHATRLQLAEQGLPQSGEVGFELLDNTQFGASQFTEQVTYQRALEGELASSVEAVHSVKSARVHLAIPRESLFVRQRQDPTASVLITLYPGRTLSEAQVSAITWLVSASIPKLSPEKVSVVDQTGRLLTQPSGEAGLQNNRRSLINDVEQRTVERIMNLLTPLVGAGNVRAQASADFDFSVREQTSEVYRPNQTPGEAAVRSKQISSSDQYDVLPPAGVPGALTNQPPVNAQAPIVEPPAAPDDAAAQNNEADNANNNQNGNANNNAPEGPASIQRDSTVNYEVDRTISHVKGPAGSLRRLSVAVVLNHRLNQEGEYEPLPEATLANIEQIVRDAMGYSQERGDTVTVINSPFSENQQPEIPVWKNPHYHDLALEALEYLLIALAVFIVWRKVLRPLIQSLAQTRVATEPAEPDSSAAGALRRSTEADEMRRASDISRYEENLKSARELAEKDPRAVAMVLRAWMDKNGKP